MINYKNNLLFSAASSLLKYGGGEQGMRPDLPNMFCNDIGCSMSESIESALHSRYNAIDLLSIASRRSQVVMHVCMVFNGDGKVSMGDMV